MAKRLHIESWVRLVVLAASFTLGSPASQALESQVLRAGVPGHFPPQYVLDSSGTPSGFAVDVLDAVATEMGFSVRYVVYATWPETLAALERREVDVIPNLGVTPVRERFTLFTLPVETFPISLFVRDIENAVSGVDDLGGRAVSVVKANIGERLIKDQTAAIPVVHSSRGDALFALLAGRSDAMVYPRDAMLSLAQETGLEDRIKVVGRPLFEMKRAIGTRSDWPEVNARLSNAVKRFVGTPQYQSIFSKWHGEPGPYWEPWRIGMGGAGVLVLTRIGHRSEHRA